MGWLQGQWWDISPARLLGDAALRVAKAADDPEKVAVQPRDSSQSPHSLGHARQRLRVGTLGAQAWAAAGRPRARVSQRQPAGLEALRRPLTPGYYEHLWGARPMPLLSSV